MKRYGIALTIFIAIAAMIGFSQSYITDVGEGWRIKGAVLEDCILLGGTANPNAAFGKVYWVNENAGSDTYGGLSPAQAFATIGAAITASNLTCGSYNMNTIYVNAQTYTEDLTTEPKNVNIIGIGAKVRIQGNHTFSTSASQNYHFWNICFRASTGTIFTTTGTHYAIGWHGCTFEGSPTALIALSIGGTQDLVIEDCRFLGNPVYVTAIQITGTCIRGRISRNYIGATTNGILLDTLASPGYGNLIDNNVIGGTMTNPNSSAQMAYGIKSEKADGHVGFTITNNRIEAVDAIYFAHTSGTNETDSCIGNITVEAGASSNEAGTTL